MVGLQGWVYRNSIFLLNVKVIYFHTSEATGSNKNKHVKRGCSNSALQSDHVAPTYFFPLEIGLWQWVLALQLSSGSPVCDCYFKNRCHRIFGPCIQSPVKNCLQFIKFENCQYQDIQQLFFSQHFKNSTSYVKIYTS
jgi:hypothetical protein